MHLGKEDYNKFYNEGCTNKNYSNIAGLTDGHVSYITDKGLASRNIARMTYLHEGKHRNQYKAGIDGSTNKSEQKACEFEARAIDYSTPARYMKQTNDFYSAKGGNGILYKIYNRNRLMNIIR